MPCDNSVLPVYDDGIEKAELANACSDLIHLRGAVRPDVAGVRDEFCNRNGFIGGKGFAYWHIRYR